MRQRAVILTALMSSVAAFAASPFDPTLTVSPPHPTNHDVITIQATGSLPNPCYDVTLTATSIAGTTLQFTLNARAWRVDACIAIVWSYSVSATVGPLTAGTYSVIVSYVAGGAPMPIAAVYSTTFTVEGALPEPLSVTTAALPAGVACLSYPPTTLAASGGTGSGYRWSVNSGSLPAGLTLSSAAVISGTLACSAVTSSFALQVRDSSGNTATQQLTIAVNAPAQIPPITADSAFQVNYAANLQVGESHVAVINTGANGAALLGPGFGPVGNICVNVYAFTPDEQLISCCSCVVTPNAVVSLGVYASVASNTQTPGTGYLPGFTASNGTGGLVIKLVSTIAGGTAAGGATANCTNSAAALTSPTTALATGMVAWRTTVHNAPPTAAPGSTRAGYTITETAFSPATLSAGEMASISGRCASIIGNSSGYGICRGCAVSPSGAVRL